MKNVLQNGRARVLFALLLILTVGVGAFGVTALAEGWNMTAIAPADDWEDGDLTTEEGQLQEALNAQEKADADEEFRVAQAQDRASSEPEDTTPAADAQDGAPAIPEELPEEFQGQTLPIIGTDGQILDLQPEAEQTSHAGAVVLWIVVIVVVLAAAAAVVIFLRRKASAGEK